MQLGDVKRYMATREQVEYRGVQYYVTGCVMRISDGDWYYQLELHDLNAPCVVIAEMSEVNGENRKG